ncbi:MAG: hypothetical protein QM820_35115 [Minicystis sp.]
MRVRLLALCLPVVVAACSRDGSSHDPAPVASASAPASPASAAVITTASAPASAEAPPANAQPRAPVREGSTIALARSGDLLYVVDEDHAVLHTVALPLDPIRRPLPLPMPGPPAQVLALADRVLVTIRSAGAVPPGKESVTGNEAPAAPNASAPSAASAAPPSAGTAHPGVPSPTGPGLLLVLRPDAEKGLVELARVELPQDAWGIAVTPDASTAIVTSAWAHKISAVDLTTNKVRWTIPALREPRAVVVRADGRAAYVTHLTGGKLTRIDNLEGPPRARFINLSSSPLRRTGDGDGSEATLSYAAVLSPDGKRLFVPRHALDVLARKAWFGASSIDVLLTPNDTPLAPRRRDDTVGFVEEITAPGGYGSDEPAHPLEAPDPDATPFAQPRAIVYLARRDTVLVAGEGTDALTEHDALAVDPVMHTLRRWELSQQKDKPVPVASDCGAPSGIALSPDEETAWVHCRSTNAVVSVLLDMDVKVPRPLVRLGDDLLPAQAALGRRLFYNGTDTVTSGGLGCAGCHPEGRDDGQVWRETDMSPQIFSKHKTFISGLGALEDLPKDTNAFHARQTPMLAGRVSAEGPYGWHGESRTLVDRVSAGFQLHRWSEGGSDAKNQRAEAIAAFVRRGLVPPPHEERPLNAKEQRGREVFLSDETLCWTCHKPDGEYTDRKAYAIFPVPSKRSAIVDPEAAFKTPSLRFVAGTAPYFHDGSAGSLAELIDGNLDRMGKTTHLSADDKAALVAFLETL